MKQNIVVLGSTGSIGISTLEVLSLHTDRFEVFALTASTNVDRMLRQCAMFKPAFAVMADEASGKELANQCAAEGMKTCVLWGSKALEDVASHDSVDIVMAAIVGSAGLASCMAAAKSGKRLLLANKEAIVVGGDLFMQAVAHGNATLLPIDSEHSAIFQSLPSDRKLWPSSVDRIILTASGGPFRARNPETLFSVTPEEACAHPNWVMGRKISVDSATMMNKALEVIEARYLFDIAPEKIEVVVHPQSVIHSMVQFVDNSVVAQLGTPDMKAPIAYGLSWPMRIQSGATALDFSRLAGLTFESITSGDHPRRYPGLGLAWQVLRAQPGSTVVLNAANEVGVEAFLQKRLRFDQIHHVNQETLQTLAFSSPQSLGDLYELDNQARVAASGLCNRLAM